MGICRVKALFLAYVASLVSRAQGQMPQASCSLSSSETCPVASMVGATQVFPGGKTRCISRWKHEYAFSVLPGDPKKLLLYFEGGGACIDPITTAMKACDEDISVDPISGDGIFNKGDIKNPFHDYTIVFVTYCSGDLFIAAKSKFYGKQYGLYNTWAAVDWAKANVAPRLQSLVLMGCSGGSLGVQLWARQLLRSFRYSRAAVVADSFVNVIPVAAEEMLINAYQVCDNGLFDTDNVARCSDKKLTIPEVFESTIAEFPDVTFASVNSKADSSQITYYNLVAKIFHAQPAKINAELFFSMANVALAAYNKYPNFVSYWVYGQQHCFAPYSILYSTDPSSPIGSGMAGVTLSDWLAALSAGHSVTSQCLGQALPQAKWPTFGTDYCDAAQAGKVYQAKIGRPNFRIGADFLKSKVLKTPGVFWGTSGAFCVVLCCILCYCCRRGRRLSYGGASDDDDEESDYEDEKTAILSE